jgi:glycosyltransferase involved in cell wall biosynthesis
MTAFVDGQNVGLTKKFIAGVEEEVAHWPGPVRVLMQPSNVETDNLDVVLLPKQQVPFDLTMAPYNSDEARAVLSEAAVAQLALDYHQTGLSQFCRRVAVPCAYVAELSLKTRLQIARFETPNPLRLARRMTWEMGQERAYRRAVSVADGVLCNGTPTYCAYSRLNRSPLLFFDTRTRASQLATDEVINARCAERRESETLRLAFSGRLVAIKGADHLVTVALELANLGRKFTFTICGAGACEGSMRQAVQRCGLGAVVDFAGSLDFESELLPLLKKNVDLFVSCHRQGDPSCTYLETMACGVPIAGYNNEAFSGVVEASGSGWVSAMDRPKRLAKLIAGLSHDEIDRHSFASLNFARQHTFEREFARRSDHLQSLIELRRNDSR